MVAVDFTSLLLWMGSLFKSTFEFGAHKALTNIHTCIELMMWLSYCVCLGIFMLMTGHSSQTIVALPGGEGETERGFIQHVAIHSRVHSRTIIEYKHRLLYDWLFRSILR